MTLTLGSALSSEQRLTVMAARRSMIVGDERVIAGRGATPLTICRARTAHVTVDMARGARRYDYCAAGNGVRCSKSRRQPTE